MSRRPLTLADLSDPREAAFVAAVFALGGPQHGAEAAIRAGYTGDPDEARLVSAILLGSSRIARAITGEVKARFDVATAAAFNAILEIVQDRKAPATARLSAAQAILDRSSVGPVPSRSMSLSASVSVEDMLARLDVEDARAGGVVEGEFREVGAVG